MGVLPGGLDTGMAEGRLHQADRRTAIQLPPGAEPAFVVRSRRPGDRFHPLGLGGSKKLKDFLIDRKIAVDFRDRLPLLLWNDEIVWVAGVAVGERFAAEEGEPGAVGLSARSMPGVTPRSGGAVSGGRWASWAA